MQIGDLHGTDLCCGQTSDVGGREALYLCGGKGNDLRCSQCTYLLRCPGTQLVLREQGNFAIIYSPQLATSERPDRRGTQRRHLGTGKRCYLGRGEGGQRIGIECIELHIGQCEELPRQQCLRLIGGKLA